MLKFDMESKGARDVPQVDQPDLYLPSESELQMAQVGFAVGNPVKQIDVLLFLPFLQCVYFSTESWNCKTDCWSQRIETKQRRPQTKGTDRFQIVSYFVWLPHIVILTKSVGFVVVINKVTHCPQSGLNLLPTECDAMLLNTTASARFPFCSKIRREKARETVRSLLLNPSTTITLERS